MLSRQCLAPSPSSTKFYPIPSTHRGHPSHPTMQTLPTPHVSLENLTPMVSLASETKADDKTIFKHWYQFYLQSLVYRRGVPKWRRRHQTQANMVLRR